LEGFEVLDQVFRRLMSEGEKVVLEAYALATVARAGMIGPEPPLRLAEMALALKRFGPVGGGIMAAAIRHGDRFGLIDERGPLSFRELNLRSNALADALAAEGLGDGATIGVLCRNHRGLLDATFAGAKAGYRILYLNTDFAAPQARDVCAREGVEALIVDEEFLPIVADVEASAGRFIAWTDGPAALGTLDSLISLGDTKGRPAPSQPGTMVMLTSGTTGTPKGARRSQPRSLTMPGAVFSKIPYRGREAVYVAPPLFHGWGLLSGLLTIGTGSTLLTSRRFDPAAVLDTVARHRCTGLVVVPAMINRMLALEDGGPASRDLSALRFMATSGAQLEGALASRTMDAFGDVLYNLYGSTEVAYATIATPEDMRAAPGCVGRPPVGTTVRLFDRLGTEVAPGETGRIFVGNGQGFSGYTGGGTKDSIDGLLSTGDVGHFDGGGRLFVDGRDDEMIVSGGENVFPGEIEELLAGHPRISEASAIGVPDADHGQRLIAYVVPTTPSGLTATEVKSYVRDNLARFKVPREVFFVEQLPRNPAGKVRKRDLLARHAAADGVVDVEGSVPGPIA